LFFLDKFITIFHGYLPHTSPYRSLTVTDSHGHDEAFPLPSNCFEENHRRCVDVPVLITLKHTAPAQVY